MKRLARNGPFAIKDGRFDTSADRAFPFIWNDTRASGLGITVSGVGHGSQIGGGVKQRRTLSCFGLVYLYSGAGRVMSRSFAETRIGPGNGFLLFPGEWHLYHAGDGEEWHEYWVLFKGVLPEFWLKAGILRPEQPLLPVTEPEAIRSLWQGVEALSKQETSAARKKLPGLMLHLLNEVLAGNSAGENKLPPILQAVKTVQERPLTEWNFKRMAEGFGMSYSLFRRLFSEHTGVPPYHFLLTERMKRAAALLGSGSGVAEAAYAIGMADPYHFSRCFRRVTGFSPRDYGRMVRSG